MDEVNYWWHLHVYELMQQVFPMVLYILYTINNHHRSGEEKLLLLREK